MRIKVFLVSIAVFIGLVLLFSSGVKAEDSTTSALNPTGTPHTTVLNTENHETSKPSGTPRTNIPTEFFRVTSNNGSPEPSETPRVRGIDKLKDLRLRFCENHQDEINTRLTGLGKLVANILGTFDAIATRVEQYYTNKVVPTGKILSNYDTLVADIASKRALVLTALSNAQNDIKGFSCTSTNPKGQLVLFRTDMQNVKKALEDYRKSIKNLIVAVRGLVGEESPMPSATPVASPI